LRKFVKTMIQKIHKEEKILEVIYSGAVKPMELIKNVKANIELAIKSGISRFLTDTRELDNSTTPIDAYELVKMYQKLGIGEGWKEAILLPELPDSAALMVFYETVSQNRGFDVKVFTNRDDAVAWLTSNS